MIVKKIPPKKKETPKQQSQLNYQSGFNADGQAVNAGQTMGNYERNARVNPLESLTDDGQRGVQDLNNQMTDNAQAQMQRSLESQNAQKNLQDQFQRSELTQQGLTNQAQMYGDISQRAVDQMGLAAKLQEAAIRNRFAVAQQYALRMQQQQQQQSISGANRVASNAERRAGNSGLLGGLKS